MSKPRKSTVDELVDTFDRFDVDIQERVLDQLELVHRLTKRRSKPEAKTSGVSPETARDAAADMKADMFGERGNG